MNKKLSLLSLVGPLALTLPLCATAASSAEQQEAHWFDQQVAFDQAMSARESGQLQKSIDILKALVAKYPDLARARLELAVAYARNLQYAPARQQAQQVLDDPATPADVKERVKLFLKQLDTASQPSTFHGGVSVGLLVDSNVNAGPSTSVIGTNVLPASTVERSDNALILSADINHRYLARSTLRVGSSDSDRANILWLSHLGYYRVSHQQELDRDLDMLNVSTGPTLAKAGKWSANLNFEFDALRLRGANYARFNAIHPSVTWPLNGNKAAFTLDGTMQLRNYMRPIDNGRDSRYTAYGLAARNIVRNDTLTVRASIHGFTENADLTSFGRDGYNLSGSLNLATSKSANLFVRGEFEHSKYDGPYSSSNLTVREETMRRASLGANTALQDGWLQGWTLEGTYTYTDTNSNIAVYDYRRDQLLVSLKWAF